METIRVQFYGEERGYCKTIFKDNEKDRYFNRISGKGGAWYTVSPNGGYWESSSLVSNDVLFEIVDRNGNLLFSEGNGTEEKSFRPIDEMAKEQCRKWAEKLNLQTYREWRDMLVAEKEAYRDENYIENWLYAFVNSKNETIIGTFEHLGLSFKITQKEYSHRICGKQWTAYDVYNTETGACEGICGYKF